VRLPSAHYDLAIHFEIKNIPPSGGLGIGPKAVDRNDTDWHAAAEGDVGGDVAITRADHNVIGRKPHETVMVIIDNPTQSDAYRSHECAVRPVYAGAIYSGIAFYSPLLEVDVELAATVLAESGRRQKGGHEPQAQQAGRRQ
jgi:hypothetical protein